MCGILRLCVMSRWTRYIGVKDQRHNHLYFRAKKNVDKPFAYWTVTSVLPLLCAYDCISGKRLDRLGVGEEEKDGGSWDITVEQSRGSAKAGGQM